MTENICAWTLTVCHATSCSTLYCQAVLLFVSIMLQAELD